MARLLPSLHRGELASQPLNCAPKTLMAAGYLMSDDDRSKSKVSLPDNTRPRMYDVKGSILDNSPKYKLVFNATFVHRQ